MDQIGMFLITTLPTGAAVLLLIAFWWNTLVSADRGRRAMLIERFGIRGYLGLSLVKIIGLVAASAAAASIWWFADNEAWWKGLAMLAATIVSPWLIGTLGGILLGEMHKNRNE